MWWRSLLKVLISILLIASLILFVLTFSLSKTISYEKLKPVVSEAIKETIMENITDENEIEEIRTELIKNCTNEDINKEVEIEVPIGKDVEKVTMKCSEIKISTPQQTIDIFANSLFDKIYYKEYNCALVDCLKNPPASIKGNEPIIFISNMASKEFKKYANYLFIIAIILILLIIVLSVPKYGALTTLGIDFLIASLPFFIFKFVLTKISLPEVIAGIIKQFFNFVSICFLVIMIIGAILLVAGIFSVLYKKRKVKRKK